MSAQFLTQTEWFGISFASLGVTLTEDALPSVGFYRALYAKLRRRFPSYDDFPADWLATKEDLPGHCGVVPLKVGVFPTARVQSYMEHCLVGEHGFSDLWMCDPTDAAAQYWTLGP